MDKYDINSLCSGCVQEIQEQFFSEDFQENVTTQSEVDQKSRKENYNYSVQQSSQDSQSMDFPFKPFDLFIQMAILRLCPSIDISYRQTPSTLKKKDNTHVQVTWQNLSFSPAESIKMFASFDPSCSFALHLKMGGLYLGQSLLFMTRQKEIVTYILLSSRSQINYEVDQFFYYFYSYDLDNKTYLTQNHFSNKSNIWHSLKHIADQPLLPPPETSVLLVFDLHRLVNNSNFQFLFRPVDQRGGDMLCIYPEIPGRE